MSSVKQLQKYVADCGLTDVVVDEKTLLLTSDGVKELGTLKEEGSTPGSVGYYINLDYAEEAEEAEEAHSASEGKDFKVYASYAGIFVVKDNRLTLFASIYECGDPEWSPSKTVISVTGHEETAVVILTDLNDSFVYHTR